jgi:hypothetical protein
LCFPVNQMMQIRINWLYERFAFGICLVTKFIF